MAENYAQEKLSKMGDARDKMSAFEMAVFGKNLAEKNIESNSQEESPMSAVEIDPTDSDWKQTIKEVEENKILRFFSKRIDFKLNGTQFSGKVGFSVKAGIMPLFDGAVIDLKSSQLVGMKPSKATPNENMNNPSSYKNWVEGTGGMLVLAPPKMDNVIPMTMEKIVITEKDMVGIANKKIDFKRDEEHYFATGIKLTKDNAVLLNPSYKKNANETDTKLKSAEVTGEGIISEQEPQKEEPKEVEPQKEEPKEVESQQKTSVDINSTEKKQHSDSHSESDGTEKKHHRHKHSHSESDGTEKKHHRHKHSHSESDGTEKKHHSHKHSHSESDGTEKKHHRHKHKKRKETDINNNEQKETSQTPEQLELVKDTIRKTRELNLKQKIVTKAREKIIETLSGDAESEDEESKDYLDKTKEFVERVITGEGNGFLDQLAVDFINGVIGGSERKDKLDAEQEEKQEEEEQKKFRFFGNYDINEDEITFGVEKYEKEDEEDANLVEEIIQESVNQVAIAVHEAFKAGVESIDEKQFCDAVRGVVDELVDGVVSKSSQVKNNVKELVSNVSKNKDIIGKFLVAAAKRELKEDKVEQIVTDALKNSMKREEELKEISAQDAIKEFLGINTEKDSDEAESKDDEEKNDGEFTLGAFTLLPTPLVFISKLKVGTELSPSFNVNVKGLKEMIKKKDDSTVNIHLNAGLAAALSLALEAGVETGIPFIIKGYAGLYAKTEIAGREGKTDESSNNAVNVSADIGVGYNRKTGKLYQKEPVIVDFNLGFQLTGSVGAEGYVESKLFMWKKSLFEKEFAKWNLAEMEFMFRAKKNLPANGEANGLMQGWEMDKTSFSLEGPKKGVGKTFVAANPEKQNYGLSDIKEVEDDEYKNLETNFKNALALLDRFKDNDKKSNEMLAIPTNKNESGASDTAKNLLDELQDNFVSLWAKSIIVLQNAKQKLDAYLNDDVIKAKKLQLDDSKYKHSFAIEQLKRCEKEKDLEKKHETLGYIKTHGFERHLENKAKQQGRTFENILNYEKNRYLEYTEHHHIRAKNLENWISQKKSDKDIIKLYKKTKVNDVSGGERAFKGKATYSTIGDMKKYHMEQIKKDAKDSREHYEKTLIMYDKVKKNEKEKKAFYKNYAKSLKDTNQITFFGDTNILLNYEKSRLNSIGKGNAIGYFKAKGEASKDNNNEKRSLKEIQKAEKKEKEAINKELYLSATVDEIKEFIKNKKENSSVKELEAFDKSSNDKNGEKIYDKIFTERKKNKSAKASIEKEISSKFNDEFMQYMSIDILEEYARKRQKRAKTMEQKKIIAGELTDLSLIRAELRTIKDPDELASETKKKIDKYFEKYDGVQESYKKEIKDGTEYNYELIKTALLREADNGVTEYLENNADKPAYVLALEIVNKKNPDSNKAYIDKDEFNKYLINKRKDVIDNEVKKNYYAAKLAGDEDTGGHLARYQLIKNMMDNGEKYDDILKAYNTKYNGGAGYRDYLKECISEGKIEGKEISLRKIEEFERKCIDDSGIMHREILKMLETKNDEEIVGNGEFLSDYRKKIYEYKSAQGGVSGLISEGKKAITDFTDITFESDFEKSISEKKNPTAIELLEYERNRENEVGKKHKERILKLLSKDSMTFEEIKELDVSNIVKNQTLTKEAMDEAQREYIQECKRYKSDDSIKESSEAWKSNVLNNDDLLFDELMTYQLSREKTYQDSLNELNALKGKLETQISTLSVQSEASMKIVNALINVQENPSKIIEKETVEKFRSAVEMFDKKDELVNNVKKSEGELVTNLNKNIEVQELMQQEENVSK